MSTSASFLAFSAPLSCQRMPLLLTEPSNFPTSASMFGRFLAAVLRRVFPRAFSKTAVPMSSTLVLTALLSLSTSPNEMQGHAQQQGGTKSSVRCSNMCVVRDKLACHQSIQYAGSYAGANMTNFGQEGCASWLHGDVARS